jgi:uncharacterized membrane protein
MASVDKQSAKKAAVLGTGKKRQVSLIPIFICAVLLVSGGIFWFFQKGDDTVSNAPVTEITYPAELFQDGKARHFQYRVNDDVTIKYFILTSSDGVIRAAFDACDVCWPAGKGYYQDGDFMVCRNCGRRFASVKVNEVRGGCNPAPLTRQVADGKLVIHVKDLMEGRQYFDFSRRG